MKEIEDPAIKLFGEKIPLSTAVAAAAACEVKWMKEEAGDVEEETEQGVDIDVQIQSEVPSVMGEGSEESEAYKSMKESSDRGKTLKKPDKIFPCPRCDSMDTKFCYYNNYNVNQPRHFCRACQRYWTAGGVMRNMAVGAGRRKNKSTTCRYRHIMISGALEGAQIDVPNSVQLSNKKINGAVLRFGADIEKQGEDCSSSASSITISNSADNGSSSFAPDRKELNRNGIASQFPCIPGFPWPYPWSPAPPLTFYPAAPFWTWNIPFVLSQQPSSPDNQRTSVPSTDSATPGKYMRDSHPQPEVESSKQRNGCVVVPKIRRIDDPDEVAKSSIWTSLGIKNDAPKIRRIDDPDEVAKSSIWTSLGIKNDANTKGALSGGFQPMGSGKVLGDEKFPALHANPAALSRSLNFHENN